MDTATAPIAADAAPKAPTKPTTVVVTNPDGSRTVTLARQIATKGGARIETLTLVPMELRHSMMSETQRGGAAQAAALIAALAGIADADARRLSLQDLRAIEAAPATAARLPTLTPTGEGVAVTLAHPITIDGGAKVERLQLRVPDIEASIAVEAVARNERRDGVLVPLNPAEQTAAMLATLTGFTIPDVARLRMIDVAAIEAWLLPFVNASSSKAEAGATSP
jgi:hypothetical protein